MRRALPVLIIFLPLLSFAQDCTGGRYIEVVFPTVVQTNAIVFGSNTAVSGGQQTLRFDVYEPEGDTYDQRPVVLVAFGGSFISGSRTDANVQNLCRDFAKRGYVAIAPDYRVGFFLPNSLTTTLAVMRGTHDMKACVRYLRKTVAEDENLWRIDVDRIITGGISAGGISALHATYLDQESEMPESIVSMSAELGGIEGNSGHPSYSSDVAACYSLSGALGDTLWIEEGDVPLVSIHEVGDQVVPYYTQEVSVIGVPTGLIASGSHDIHLRMDNLGIDNCLLTYNTNGHVGYLAADPVASREFLFDFCAGIVCGIQPGCVLATGVAESISSDQDVIFPNPASDRFTVIAPASGMLSITDMRGAVVMETRVIDGMNTLDIAQLPAGIYMIHMPGSLFRAQRLVIAR